MLVIDALKQMLRLWWNHLVHLTLFNFCWLLCQLLIIPGAAATATMYLLVERLMDGELVTLRDAWEIFRGVFVPALQWSVCNWVVLGGALGVLWWAQTQAGVVGVALSVFALIVIAFWLALNLLYWSLWLAQSEPNVGNTFRNALVIFGYNPVTVLLLLLISVVIVIVSALTILPLIHFLMVWLAIFGMNTTQALIRSVPKEN